MNAIFKNPAFEALFCHNLWGNSASVIPFSGALKMLTIQGS